MVFKFHCDGRMFSIARFWLLFNYQFRLLRFGIDMCASGRDGSCSRIGTIGGSVGTISGATWAVTNASSQILFQGGSKRWCWYNSSTDSTPEHMFPKFNTLLPSSLLILFSIASPMPVLDCTQKGKEVTNTPESCCTIRTKWITLCVAGLACAETMRSYVLSIIA